VQAHKGFGGITLANDERAIIQQQKTMRSVLLGRANLFVASSIFLSRSFSTNFALSMSAAATQQVRTTTCTNTIRILPSGNHGPPKTTLVVFPVFFSRFDGSFIHSLIHHRDEWELTIPNWSW
jgi:hypothetical protein